MPIKKRVLQDIIEKLSFISDKNNIENIYIVGGYPRSLIMENVKDDVNDIDVASAWPRESIKLGNLFSSEFINELPDIYNRTGTLKINYKNVDLEFQGVLDNIFDYEKEIQELSKNAISINPLNLNIYSRDFTLNTLIMNLNDYNVYDITGFGIRDIEDKIIRTPIDPNISIKDNTLNILRALRFSVRYNFNIDDKLLKAIDKYKKYILKENSIQRVQIEILKMLKENKEDSINVIKEFGMENLIKNNKYNIYNSIKNIDIENYEDDLKNLIGENLT